MVGNFRRILCIPPVVTSSVPDSAYHIYPTCHDPRTLDVPTEYFLELCSSHYFASPFDSVFIGWPLGTKGISVSSKCLRIRANIECKYINFTIDLQHHGELHYHTTISKK